jgi:hypothetical protein
MMDPILRFLKTNGQKISEINKRYATPRIKMTRGIAIALFMLRIYLLFLVGLLVFKFITLLR